MGGRRRPRPCRHPSHPGCRALCQRNPPPAEEIPRFVAHLIVTCLAAAESNEEVANENSFIVRLRELTDDQLPDASLAHLPRLWSNLAAWLATDANRRLYRSLTLPDPGGFTRIGYSVKLTFPDRRDQAELSRLLDEYGLGGTEPPVASVLRLVSENRGKFRRSLIDAYQSFRHEREAAPRSPHIREHRFWVAVREAAFRGRGATAAEEFGGRVQVLAEPQDERLALFIVADRPIVDHPQLVTAEMNGGRACGSGSDDAGTGPHRDPQPGDARDHHCAGPRADAGDGTRPGAGGCTRDGAE